MPVGKPPKPKTHEEMMKEDKTYKKMGASQFFWEGTTSPPNYKQERYREERNQESHQEFIDRMDDHLKQALHEKTGVTITPRRMRKTTG